MPPRQPKVQDEVHDEQLAAFGSAPEADDDPGDDPHADVRREQLDPHATVDDIEWLEGDWTPPGLLQAPPPRPGMVQRWVKVETRGLADIRNVTRRRSEGWRPRDPRSVPDMDVPTQKLGSLGACIAIEGMVLMEMPMKRARQRAQHYREIADSQMGEVNDMLRHHQDPGHPIRTEIQSQVTVGQGMRRPTPMEDAL